MGLDEAMSCRAAWNGRAVPYGLSIGDLAATAFPAQPRKAASISHCGVRGSVNERLIGESNVAGNHLPDTSRSRLRPMAALLRCVCPALAQVVGPRRGEALHR